MQNAPSSWSYDTSTPFSIKMHWILNWAVAHLCLGHRSCYLLFKPRPQCWNSIQLQLTASRVLSVWTVCVCVCPAARVVVDLRVVGPEGGVAFWSSFYNFSLPENQPVGATVGRVVASSGSDLHNVTYTLKTHTDLFSISISETCWCLNSVVIQHWFIRLFKVTYTIFVQRSAETNNRHRWVNILCSYTIMRHSGFWKLKLWYF